MARRKGTEMEWALLLKAIEVAPEVIGALTGLAGAAYGVWKGMQARNWAKTARNFEGLLASMATAVEMLPRGARTAEVKLAIDRMQRYSGQHSAEWVALIKQIESIVRNAGLNDRAEDVAALSRAADAVAGARAARKGRKSARGLGGGFAAFLVVVGLSVGLSGCVALQHERVTRETVWPADAEGFYAPEIVVEWPEGVAAQRVLGDAEEEGGFVDGEDGLVYVDYLGHGACSYSLAYTNSRLLLFWIGSPTGA